MSDNRTDDRKAKDCEDMLKYLAAIRLPFESMVDNTITYVNHSRRKIIDKDTIKGQKTGTEVYDGTPLRSKNILVDGMASSLCPRNQDWFRYTLPGKLNFPHWSGMRAWSGKRMDEYPQVRIYLQNCEEVGYSAFRRSNFYDVITELISDAATPGTAHLLSEEDVGAGRIIFTVPHFRECYIAENQYGFVDTNYRVYKMTLRQLADKFTMERMSEIDVNFKKDYDSNFYMEKEIIHAIYPRKDYDQSKINGKNKPVASLWILRSPLKLIDETGYNWNPSFTWRWRKNSDECYGRSPSWDSFVTNMGGQQQKRSNLIAGHKMVEPPMVAPSDLRGAVNVGPKGWTFVEDMARQMPKPLMTGIQLPYGVEQLQMTQQEIREDYYVPFFLMLYQAAMNKVELTATQVVEMMGEQASVLGTRVGNFQTEILDPVHDRVFDIEARAGRMPEPPAILQEQAGGTVEIDYLGALAKAQTHLARLRSIRSGVQIVGEIGQIAPTALDVPDWDEVVKEALDASGFPFKLIRSDDQIKKIREVRAKQVQQEKTIEALPKIAKAMHAAGKGTEEGSPLQALTGLGPKEEEVGGTP